MTSKDIKSSTDIREATPQLADVLAGCRSGNHDAQRRLYELYQGRVFRLMLRMVGGEDAADLMQQAFLQLFRKIGRFAGRSSFDTWMYRLCVNEALQHLRRKQRRKFQSLLHEPASNAVHTSERNEQQELLQLALARLEPELRSIFILREIEGLSYREIAETIEVPVGTVGSRLNRARKELQQHLTELGWNP